MTLDGETVYENPRIKQRLMFVPDELYFLPNADIRRMASLYKAVYPSFDSDRLHSLLEHFQLPDKKAIRTFSKGMRRLAATALALAVRPDVILFDETMDGLDPVMRHLVKRIIADDVAAQGTTAIVVSHSLRELEDLCDQLALLHQGGIVFEQDVADLKTTLFKIQIAFGAPFDRSLFSELDIVHYRQQGSVASLILRGEHDRVQAALKEKSPLLLDILPLSLEEVFTYELQARNYNIGTLLGGDEV